jgi:probable F420-dependent oxidoreductase
MKISVRIFGFPLDSYAPIARAADAAGFESLWIPEHLVAPLEFEANYPYRSTGKPSFLPDTPFADPWVMLGHLAAVTTRIKMGVGVFVLPLRNPFVVAKAAGTAQTLAAGRIMMGVGIGWMREEFNAVGEKFDKRGARTDEMLAVMRKLWTGEPVEHAGEWYRFAKLQMSPGLATPLPIVMGGAGELAIKRAARVGDGWYGPPCDLAAAKDYREQLLRALAVERRDPATFHLWVRAPAVSDESGMKAAMADFRDAGFEHLVVQVPLDLPDAATRVAWIEQLARWCELQ